MKVVKVYGKDGEPPFYFINGTRSDAYDDLAVLQEIFGEEFQEYWLASEYVLENDEQDRAMSLLESAETLTDFEATLEDYPELVEEIA
jgi:hypothetical protein